MELNESSDSIVSSHSRPTRWHAQKSVGGSKRTSRARYEKDVSSSACSEYRDPKQQSPAISMGVTPVQTTSLESTGGTMIKAAVRMLFWLMFFVLVQIVFVAVMLRYMGHR